MPVSIEQHVEWIAECIAHMGRNKLATIEATSQAQSAWGDWHVAEVVSCTRRRETIGGVSLLRKPIRPRKRFTEEVSSDAFPAYSKRSFARCRYLSAMQGFGDSSS